MNSWMKMKGLAFSFVAVFWVISASSAGAVEPGSKAPDFTLSGVDGKAYHLADSSGKYVVLEWLNLDCPFVKKHYGSHNMQSLQKKYGDKGVVWYSVISSAAGKQGNYTPAEVLKKEQAWDASPTAVLLDPDGKVGHLFDAKTTPHIFVIDPKGTVIYQGAIDDKPSTNPKDIPGAKNYLAQALDASMTGKPVAVTATESYGCSVKY